MAINMNQTGDARRIAVQCCCGKRLTALPQHVGKLVKCPACGQAVVVPGNVSPQTLATPSPVEDESERMSRNTLIDLWSFVGVFTLGCVLFLVWYSHSSHQSRIAAANDRISQAVTAANEWMDGKSSLDGEAVEQKLVDAIKDEDAIETGNGASVLSQVRRQRELFAEQARTERAQREATAVLTDAKRQVEGKHITEAIALLRTYVENPHATEKADAQRLLAEAETAVSDTLTLNFLNAMSDEEFGRVKAAGEIRNRKVTHPVLLAVQNETVQRNLDKAIIRREEIKIAEATRREAEIRRERELAEEQRRLRENPLILKPEDVDAFPERYFGKYVAFAKVQISGRAIERTKNLRGGVFTLGVRSQRDKYFTGVVYNDLFFSCTDTMAESLMNLVDARSSITCNIYCHISRYKKSSLVDVVLPEAKVYKIEVYNLGGEIRKVFSE